VKRTLVLFSIAGALGGLRIPWNARAGPTGTRQDDLSRRWG